MNFFYIEVSIFLCLCALTIARGDRHQRFAGQVLVGQFVSVALIAYGLGLVSYQMWVATFTDLIVFASLVFIYVNSDKAWPIFAAGFQFSTLSFDFRISIHQAPYNFQYTTYAVFCGWLVLVALLCGLTVRVVQRALQNDRPLTVTSLPPSLTPEDPKWPQRPFGARDPNIGAPYGARLLTGKEERCTLLAGEGLSSKEIGKIVGLSPNTVDFHLKKVMKLYEVRTRKAAAEIAGAMKSAHLSATAMPTTTRPDFWPALQWLVKDAAQTLVNPQRGTFRTAAMLSIAAYTIFSVEFAGPLLIRLVERLPTRFDGFPR